MRNQMQTHNQHDIARVLRYLRFIPEVHAVGGCVRDMLLNRPIKDVDITSPTTPDALVALLTERMIPHAITGEAHGTVTIITPLGSVEHTTFRTDVSTDGRRATIEFAKTLDEDLQRRDFTINAIAVTLRHCDALEIVDPLNGQKDIVDRKLRFVGNPHDRIKEDYLRIIRLYRFAALLNFKIDQSTTDAINVELDNIDQYIYSIITKERVLMEIKKLINPQTNLFDPDVLNSFFSKPVVRQTILKEFDADSF